MAVFIADITSMYGFRSDGAAALLSARSHIVVHITLPNETENEHLNESISKKNDNFYKYFTPDEFFKTIGLENKNSYPCSV